MHRTLCLLLAWTFAAAGALGAGEAGKPPEVIERFAPLDTSRPDHVIGNGTPQSVTLEALQSALQKGGVIVFNTGGQPVTLLVTQPLDMPQTAKPTIIDGHHFVTLDGGGKSNLLQKGWKTELAVQRLKFQHARAEKEGAAIHNTKWDGRMTVIDCQFTDCKTTSKGPDIGGGAIRVTGQKNLIVSNCLFTDCAGSNGGAICTIGCQMTIVGCTFTNCRAFGSGGGADAGPNGQGGIGGAVYIDGVDQNADKKLLYVGDCYFKDNSAGAHAGAIFGYTRPNQDSVSIYYNTIFENSSVDKVEGYRGTHGGAIYSMYCHLHVVNCTFANNKSPSIGGAIFSAKLIDDRYVNCEFYGNTPEFRGTGENVSLARMSVAPAVAALGRMPGALAGPEAALKAAPSAAQAVAPAAEKRPAPPPKRVASSEAVARYVRDLRVRATAALGQGVRPRFMLTSLKQDVELLKAGDDEALIQMRGGGGKLNVPWKQFSNEDWRNLSLALVAEESAEDHARAAFFLYLTDKADLAREHLDKAREHAAAVETAFGTAP
ncbi:MAG: right-handed parallel beta-helix repeat-containing protein [Planctomycetes bacterium]|nr:right-handed parallel beta-helix repeat-containing protein [Planctomycetota bacterium]